MQALKLPGFNLGRSASYNPGTLEQVDRLVEGYVRGLKLSDLMADPSLLVTAPEVELEDQGEY